MKIIVTVIQKCGTEYVSDIIEVDDWKTALMCANMYSHIIAVEVL